MNRRFQAEFVALAAIWGASFLFMRIAAPAFGPAPLMLLRATIGAAVLLPVLWFGRDRAVIGRSLRANVWRLAFVGVLNSALPFVLFGYAALSLNAGFASILNATTPIFGALIGYLWLRERLNGWRIAGLAVGVMGVAVLSWERASFREGGSGWAIVAILVATFCYGIVGNFAKRELTGVDPMLTAASSQVFAALALLLPGVIWWPAVAPAATDWWAAIGLGAMASGIAYLLYYRLIANIGPPAALSVTYLIPVFGVIWGWIFLGETVDAATLVGGAIVLLGTAFATGMLPPRRTPRGRS